MRSLTIAGLVLATATGGAFGNSLPLTPQRQNELIRLVRQDCGSCHGMQLRGGLGPALTRQTLQDKPAAALISTILYGRPGTAMPPWERFLSEAEASWIVDALQKGFPDGH